MTTSTRQSRKTDDTRSPYSRFTDHARRVAARAPHYKTLTSCQVAITKLHIAYRRNGSFGCVHHELREAVWAVQLRAAELLGQAHDAKYGRAAS